MLSFSGKLALGFLDQSWHLRGFGIGSAQIEQIKTVAVLSDNSVTVICIWICELQFFCIRTWLTLNGFPVLTFPDSRPKTCGLIDVRYKTELVRSVFLLSQTKQNIMFINFLDSQKSHVESQYSSSLVMDDKETKDTVQTCPKWYNETRLSWPLFSQ